MQLVAENSQIAQGDIAAILMDEGLCKRAMAFRHAAKALGVDVL
jgi:hypothetical protein